MHKPVLLKEVIEGLELKQGMTVLDATLGGGGHSLEICKAIGKEGTLIGLDQDVAAIKRNEGKFSGVCGAILKNINFRDLGAVLSETGISKIDAAIFDLGLSSFQLEGSGRGFSFQKDEPLLMTFMEEPTPENLTAKDIVNEWAEGSLADIIYGYGGEKFSRRIARAIVEARETGAIETSGQLVSIIGSAVPSIYKKRKIHFATKTFQALRIAANDELGALKDGLAEAWHRLNVGGRIALISFHELEDRFVKNFLRKKREFLEAEIITKKPIVATNEEIGENIRSRSAKLRIAKKINAYS